MSYKDVNSFRDEIPLLQECLASWEVESPAIEPGLPRREGGGFRDLRSMAPSQRRVQVTGLSSHEDELNTWELNPNETGNV